MNLPLAIPIQAMTWQILCVVLFVLMTEAKGTVEYPILVKDPSAVCIDGTPAGYYHILGSGEGANNWLVNLEGGAWCGANGTGPVESCQQRRTTYYGSTNKLLPVKYFDGILSSIQTHNPDFFNWNKIVVHYCDGSSFIGDTEIKGSGPNLQLRGSRIFTAVIDELLEKGMRNATNAILAGYSAGGLATILHCDEFRALLSNVGRVKCVSDSGFFIHAKDLPDADYRESFFGGIIDFHNLTGILPVSCTSRMNANLCLFPEYLVGDVSTPLFLVNTAFDTYQIQNLLKAEPTPDRSWDNCKQNATANACTPTQKQLIKDFGKAFLKTLKEIGNNPLRGMFINCCYYHVCTVSYQAWNSIGSPKLENKTISEAVGDWYFDRNSIQLIDTQTDFALNCT